MEFLQEETFYPVDLWVKDRQNNVILVANVRFRAEGESYLYQLEEHVRGAERFGKQIPFAMLVTHDQIQLYRWDGNNLLLTKTLETPKVLSAYDPEFGQKRIFEFYAETLIEAWLQDLALHWKNPRPPGEDDFREVGLLDQLTQAFVYSGDKPTTPFDP